MTRAHSVDFKQGVRACITWLHEEAAKMNDPHARAVLNSAAFHLGIAKPTISISASPPLPEVGDEAVERMLTAYLLKERSFSGMNTTVRDDRLAAMRAALAALDDGALAPRADPNAVPGASATEGLDHE